MKFLMLIFFLLFSFSCYSQSGNDSTFGKKDNLRLSFYLPTEPAAFLISYERNLSVPTSLYIKAGPTIGIRKFGSADNPYQFSFNVLASIEMRYYWNMVHRLRKGKYVKNKSGFYIGAEQQIKSNTLFTLNEEKYEGDFGRVGAYLNAGYQYQKNHFYFNVYLGLKLYAVDLSKYHNNDSAPSGQTGLSIGYAF